MMIRSPGLISLALIALTLILLTGCGGGGSDGGGDVAAPPPPTPTHFGTLAITQDNAEVVGFAVAMAEAALSVAQAAANEVIVFASPSGAVSRECNSDGLATITLVDADSSFTVSAGDSLVIEYDRCFSVLVDGEMTGTIEIDVTAFEATESSANLAASVNVVNPLQIANLQVPIEPLELTVTMDIAFSLGSSENISVRSSGANEFAVTAAGVTESISDFDIARTARLPNPDDWPNLSDMEMDLSFDLEYDSGVLGGSVTCGTDPLLQLVRSNVSAANVSCRGLNGSAVRTTGAVDVGIDPEGDGSFAVLGRIDWLQVFDGFMRRTSGLSLDALFSSVEIERIMLAVKDIFYDASRDRLLVVTSALDAFAPSALVGVSLAQNTLAVLESYATEPSAVALSADDNLLYVGFAGHGEVRKYDASTLQPLATLWIESDDPLGSEYGVRDLAVSPVAPNTVAASFNYFGTTAIDVAVFADDVQLTGRYRNVPETDYSAGEYLFFSEDGERIHSFSRSSNGIHNMVVGSTGVTATYTNYRFGSDLALADGRLYSNEGEYDDETYVRLGTFGHGVRNLAVDTANNRFYSESNDTFEVWDLERRLPIATYQLELPQQSVRRLETAGDHVVLVTDVDLRVIDRSDIEPLPPGECTVGRGQTVDGNGYTQYACDVIDAVYDPVADRIYAAVSSEVPGNGNSIAVINHVTESVENYIPVPSNPKRLVLSADGTRLYAVFADAELLVAIDTGTQTIANTWQTGILTARDGYNELDPRRILSIAGSPLEPNTVVTLMSERSNTLDKELVAFRDGVRLPDEIPVSALRSNTSSPYPRLVFDDLGSLYALHLDQTTPYFESLLLSTTGLAVTGAWFDATGADWHPYEVSVAGTDVFFPIGDVINVVDQTVARRFDYETLPFFMTGRPWAVHAEAGSDDVWFVTRANSETAGLARFNKLDGTLIGTEEFPVSIWGRNSDFSHTSIFGIGTDRLGLVIDEREGVLVIDRSVVQ